MGGGGGGGGGSVTPWCKDGNDCCRAIKSLVLHQYGINFGSERKQSVPFCNVSW